MNSLVYEVAGKRRAGSGQWIQVSRHSAVLALQAVPVGQDKTLLTSFGFDVLARDGDLEPFDVLSFDLRLDDTGSGSFGRG